jgi:hypothetical protein
MACHFGTLPRTKGICLLQHSLPGAKSARQRIGKKKAVPAATNPFQVARNAIPDINESVAAATNRELSHSLPEQEQTNPACQIGGLGVNAGC